MPRDLINMSRNLIDTGLNFVQGSYAGNGHDGRVIECGFNPDLVIIKAATAQHGVFRTSSHVGDDTSYFASSSANLADAIQGFQEKGFSLGTNAVVNSAGVLYHYAAFKDANLNNFKVGVYEGDGVDGRSVTGLGFQPDLVWVKRNGASLSVFRDSLEVGDLTHQPTSAGYIDNAIQSITADGFTVGDRAEVNTNGDDYYYFAFKISDHFDVGTYNGNGADDRDITGVDFQPTLAVVKRAGTGVGNGANSSVIRFETAQGDLSSTFANSAFASNFIQALNVDGFQVGTNAVVNENSAPLDYHYYVWKKNRMRVNA